VLMVCVCVRACVCVCVCVYWHCTGCQVVFQDRNVEVLRDATLPNVLANVSGAKCQALATFVVGDWSQVNECLQSLDLGASVSSSSSGQYDMIVTTETVYTPVCVDGGAHVG